MTRVVLVVLVGVGFIVSNEKRRELVRTKWLEMQISVAGDSTADKQPVREPARERDGDTTKFKYPTISPAVSSAQLYIGKDETKDGI